MKNMILILIFLAALVMEVLSLKTINNNFNKEIQSTFAPYNQLFTALKQRDLKNKQWQQYDQFTAALADVDKTYNRGNNNCYDHSKALQASLLKRGIVSSIFIDQIEITHGWEFGLNQPTVRLSLHRTVCI